MNSLNQATRDKNLNVLASIIYRNEHKMLCRRDVVKMKLS